MNILWNRSTGTEGALAPSVRAPRPEKLSYFIGDIHGCHTKMHLLLERISKDRDGRDAEVVFLGDYVDRGADSANVLRDLMELDQSSEIGVTFLAGNHDRMMLRFLEQPDPRSGHWLTVGGANTLASFAALPESTAIETRLEDTAARLAEAMGSELIDWLRERPLWWRSGNVIAVHALTEPRRPMEDQSERTLLWARPDEQLAPREDGCWVVHGHTMVPSPTVRSAHIAVDTGAVCGNPLTAAVLDQGDIRFLQAA